MLLDQNAPKRLVRALPRFDMVTARLMGWSELSNGDLIAAAEWERFDILLTADRNLRHQQSLAGRHIAVVILETNRWSIVRQDLPVIENALDLATPGSFCDVRSVPMRSEDSSHGEEP